MARTRRGDFYIDDTCIGCGACEHACPGKVDAIFKTPGDFIGRFYIEAEDCINCGKCVPLCPVDCIHDAREEGVVEGEGGYTVIRSLEQWAQRSGTAKTN